MIIAQTTIRRARWLPAPGEIIAYVGQRVESPDVIGRAALPGEVRVIPVTRLLGVPDDRLTDVCLHRAGDGVKEGDVLARQRSLPRPRIIRAPSDGLIIALSDGRVIMEVAPKLVEVRAGLSGTIVGILGGGQAHEATARVSASGQGVMIELTGALVQGVWGSGQEAYGLLKVVAGPDTPLRPEDIDVSCHGSIVVGGSALSEATLRQAQQMQVRGMVIGGLPADLREAVIDLPFPILVVEGIGHRPMAASTFELLKAHDGYEATLNANMPGRWETGKPELIIPLPASADAHAAAGTQSTEPSMALLPAKGDAASEQPAPPLALAPGARVRALREPYAGAIGTIKKLYERPRPLPTGGRLPGAEVDFGGDANGAAQPNGSSGQVVFIPFANLERVE